MSPAGTVFTPLYRLTISVSTSAPGLSGYCLYGPCCVCWFAFELARSKVHAVRGRWSSYMVSTRDCTFTNSFLDRFPAKFVAQDELRQVGP